MPLRQWRIHSNSWCCLSGALKQQPADLFQRALLPSANDPTNPFLTNSKKSDGRNVLQTHINTVDEACAFQWVQAAIAIPF